MRAMLMERNLRFRLQTICVHLNSKKALWFHSNTVEKNKEQMSQELHPEKIKSKIKPFM